MKFLHIADLHLGKRLNDVSLLEDQQLALEQVCALAEAEGAQGVIIAGDVYQKASPQAEAMTLFNDFVTALAEKGIKVFVISGNHDSDRRISYFSKLLRLSGVYVTDAFDGRLQTVTLTDEHGKVNVCMLPYLRPAVVKRFFPDTAVETAEDAVRAVLAASPIDESCRNILVCHQLVTGAETSDSEEISVGTLDNVSPSTFEGFDYVALGHIHKPQRAGRETIRYSGSLLKYSLSEKDHTKSATVVELLRKGDVRIKTVPVRQKRDVREVSGTLEEIMRMPYSEDYVRVVVKDELPPPDARVWALTVFPNMIKYSIDNAKTRMDTEIMGGESVESRAVHELFVDFYRLQNNDVPPSDAHIALVKEILEDMKENADEAL